MRTEPLYLGPLVDGISQSILHEFYQCPFRFYVKAILGLQDSRPLHLNLIWGDVFHKGLELLLLKRDVNECIVRMIEYMNTKYPQAPPSYSVSLARSLRNYSIPPGDWSTEILFDILASIDCRSVRSRGKKDGLTLNHPDYGKCLIEHKCKDYIDATQTRLELPYDLQLNFYMQLESVDWVIYDLILIPESQKYTPARSHDESPQEWMERLFTGPCGKYNIFPVNANKHMWQQRIPKNLPPEERERYWESTIIPLISQLCIWYDYVMQYFPALPPFNHIFYKVPPRMFNGSFTEKFQCNYYKLLTNQETLEDLAPVTSLFNELEEL